MTPKKTSKRLIQNALLHDTHENIGEKAVLSEKNARRAVTSNYKDRESALYAIAEGQAGLFTAKQAQDAGFLPSSHTYHVQAGNWAREYRGIYRLTEFPAALRPELMLWNLWSMDRAGHAQGVYSHSTALALYLEPETKPTVLHMTVPRSFRRNSAIPKRLTLHSADLPKSDIAVRDGYRLTTPLRTILDLAATDLMPRAELSAAMVLISNKGLITPAQVKRAKIPEASRQKFMQLAEKKPRGKNPLMELLGLR